MTGRRLESLLTDLQDARRGLRRSPGFTAGAILVLGVGIGANMAVFTVANAALFKSFRGVADQDRLAYVTTGRDCCISYRDLADWRTESRSFAAWAAVADQRVSIDAGGGLETATATEATADLFAVLRVRPVLGRDFTRADDLPGAPGVAMLSDAYWRSHFDANPAVLGRTLRVNGTPTTVIGVMPPDFAFPQRQDLWIPLGPRVSAQPRNARGLWFAVGRLAGGVSVEQARAEMDAVGARMAAAYPATNTGVRPVVQTFREFFIGPNALALYGSLWGGVGVLLAIACANLVTLLLARATGRTREIAVRLALGASRGRVVRVQLLETMALSAGGGLAGWWIALVLTRGYAAVAVPPTQPWAAQLVDYTVDARTFAYVAAITLVSGIATGLLPALRSSSLEVQGVLRDGGRGATGSTRHRRTTQTIVIAQVALAVALLAAAGVMVRSFWIVHTRDLGYDPARVLAALASLPPSRYPDAPSQFAFLDRAAANVRGIPGIERVAFVDGLSGQTTGRPTIEIDGRSVAGAAERQGVRQLSISPGYFRTLGRSVHSGRDFDDRDTSSAPPATIVNRRLAQLYFQSDDVIGRRIRLRAGTTPGPWLTVVGVAPDIRDGDRARRDVEPMIYRPMQQRPGQGAWILASTDLHAESLIAPFRQEIQRADPELPVWLGPYTLEQWNAGTSWRRGLNGALFALFGALALVLASIGLFAVTARSVASRRQELSVRMAIGAGAVDVLWLVVRQGLAPALVGLVSGLLISLGTNRLLGAELVDIVSWDPVTLAAVAALVLLSAVTGCIVPALRAVHVDPLTTMRGD